MTTEIYILVALLGLSMPAAMLEMVLLFLVWPPYIRLLGRPLTIEGLPTSSQLREAEADGELKLRPHGGALLFRRTFAVGRGRPLYAGEISRGADGRLSARAGAAPLGMPITVAFGAFGGLTFGGGSLIVGAIFAGLFSLVQRHNRRAAMAVFTEKGVPALIRALE